MVTARVPAAFRWLGAPVLKAMGLKFAEQEDGDAPLCFCRKLELPKFDKPEPKGETESQQVPEGEASDNIEQPDDGGNMAKVSEEQFAAEQAVELQFQKEAEAARAELAQFKQDQEKADVEARLAKFRDEGRLTPAEFDLSVGLAMELQGRYREEYFSQIAARRPVLETRNEQAPARDAAAASGVTAPALWSKSAEFAQKNNLSFEAAAMRLAAQNPGLFEREEECNELERTKMRILYSGICSAAVKLGQIGSS